MIATYVCNKNILVIEMIWSWGFFLNINYQATLLYHENYKIGRMRRIIWMLVLMQKLLSTLVSIIFLCEYQIPSSYVWFHKSHLHDCLSIFMSSFQFNLVNILPLSCLGNISLHMSCYRTSQVASQSFNLSMSKLNFYFAFTSNN